ncbi:hypothetical protein ABT158_39065 [Nonomuraea sp. NPDC001636]|uniref:hypothetical protein n=1 Tax=Nonomuraea sp. NPDC001636 TaxID=3154391 RepID=UPI0033297790
MLDVVADQRAHGCQDPDAEIDDGFTAQVRQAFQQRRRAGEADAQQRDVELTRGDLSPLLWGLPSVGANAADGNSQTAGDDELFQILHIGTIVVVRAGPPLLFSRGDHA